MRTKKVVTLFGVLVAVLAAIAAAGWLYDVIRVRWPHEIRLDTEAFHVVGRYYWLPLDSVDGISVRDGRLVVGGSTLKTEFFGEWFRSTPGEVVRKLPPAFANARAVDNWSLTPEDYLPNGRRYTFRDARSNRSFSVILPSGTADVLFEALENEGATVIVFAGGDWKVGPESYFGYVTVRPAE